MEIEGVLEDALRKHVEVLTVETGPRTAFHGDGLAQAERYIREVFEISGPGVTKQAYVTTASFGGLTTREQKRLR